jgi:hypothetical protein
LVAENAGIQFREEHQTYRKTGWCRRNGHLLQALF